MWGQPRGAAAAPALLRTAPLCPACCQPSPTLPCAGTSSPHPLSFPSSPSSLGSWRSPGSSRLQSWGAQAAPLAGDAPPSFPPAPALSPGWRGSAAEGPQSPQGQGDQPQPSPSQIPNCCCCSPPWVQLLLSPLSCPGKVVARLRVCAVTLESPLCPWKCTGPGWFCISYFPWDVLPWC